MNATVPARRPARAHTCKRRGAATLTFVDVAGCTVYLAGDDPDGRAELALVRAGADVVTPTDTRGVDDPDAHVNAAAYDLDALLASDLVVVMPGTPGAWEPAVARAMGVRVVSLAEALAGGAA